MCDFILVVFFSQTKSYDVNNLATVQRVIKATKIIAEIKEIQIRWKIDTYNMEPKIIFILMLLFLFLCLLIWKFFFLQFVTFCFVFFCVVFYLIYFNVDPKIQIICLFQFNHLKLLFRLKATSQTAAYLPVFAKLLNFPLRLQYML